METPTVLKIKELRDQIKEQLASINTSQFNKDKFGSENEYSGKDIYLGLEAMLIDVSYLVRAHNIFIQNSTLAERNTIVSNLTNTLSYLESPAALADYIDALKVDLRKYNIRNNIERWELFQESNKRLLEQANEFSDSLKFINDLKEEATNISTSINEKFGEVNKKFTELEEKIEEVEEVKTEIETNSENLKEINTSLQKVKDDADLNLEKIVESFTEVKGNEKIIDSFSKKVQEKENKLVEIEQRTEENSNKLKVYDEERISILEEANNLIESAKTALNYKTAEGISASFQSQHEDAKKWQLSVSWLFCSGLFIAVAIGLGIWVLTGDTDEIHIIIGRIALIPLPIIAAIFCANQYVKQKNIIEDYAYKMVLAKSIVGFSEQLKKDPSADKGEYIHYMKVALEEIHKDPLRKRNSKEQQSKAEDKIESLSVRDVIDMAEKMIKIGKG